MLLSLIISDFNRSLSLREGLSVLGSLLGLGIILMVNSY